MKTTAMLLAATLLAAAPAGAEEPASATEAPGAAERPAPETEPPDPGAAPAALAPATAESVDVERDRWTTAAVVAVLATAVAAVAAGALIASYTPPCDASLGCTRAP